MVFDSEESFLNGIPDLQNKLTLIIWESLSTVIVTLYIVLMCRLILLISDFTYLRIVIIFTVCCFYFSKVLKMSMGISVQSVNWA